MAIITRLIEKVGPAIAAESAHVRDVGAAYGRGWQDARGVPRPHMDADLFGLEHQFHFLQYHAGESTRPPIPEHAAWRLWIGE